MKSPTTAAPATRAPGPPRRPRSTPPPTPGATPPRTPPPSSPTRPKTGSNPSSLRPPRLRGSPPLAPPRRDERLEVVVRIAQGELVRGEPAEVEAHVVLVGHADAAVELDGLLRDVAAAAASCTLAAERRLRRAGGRLASHCIAARIAVDLQSSVSTNMSTARCWSAWKVPILTPNCSRVRRYSVVIASTVRMMPTPSAHGAARAEVHAPPRARARARPRRRARDRRRPRRRRA